LYPQLDTKIFHSCHAQFSQIIYQQLPVVWVKRGVFFYSEGVGNSETETTSHAIPNPQSRARIFFLLTCFHCLHLYFCSIFNAIPPRTSRAFVLLLAISMAWHRPQGFGHHWSFRFLASNFFPGRLPTALGLRCKLLEKAFIIV